jgi:hypothetical protein
MNNKELEQRIKNWKPQDLQTTPKLRALSREGFELSIPHIASIAKGEIPEAPFHVHVQAHKTLRETALGDTPNYVIDHKDWLFTFCRVTAKYFDNQEKLDQWFAELLATFEYEQ